MYIVSGRSNDLVNIRTKTLFRKLSIYLRTSASSIFFFPFTLSLSLSLFRSSSRSPPLSLPPSLTPFSLPIQSHSAQSDGGCFFISFLFFYFLFFYSSKYRGNVFLSHVTQEKTLCVSSVAVCSFHLRKPKTEMRRFVSHSEKYAKLAVLGNISAVKK